MTTTAVGDIFAPMPPAPLSFAFSPSVVLTPVAIPKDTSTSGIRVTSPIVTGSPTTVLVVTKSSILENRIFKLSLVLILIVPSNLCRFTQAKPACGCGACDMRKVRTTNSSYLE